MTFEEYLVKTYYDKDDMRHENNYEVVINNRYHMRGKDINRHIFKISDKYLNSETYEFKNSMYYTANKTFRFNYYVKKIGKSRV